MRETRTYRHCKKVGHIRKDCFLLKRNHEAHAKDVGVAEVVTECDYAEVLIVVGECVESHWILDSRYSFHMCPDRSWFSDFRTVNSGSVILGNDESCKIEVVGQVNLKLMDGSMKVLNEVRYILGLKRNLVSLSTLEAHGCVIRCAEGIIEISKNNKLLMKCVRRNNLYYLEAEVVSGYVDNVSLNQNKAIHDARLYGI